ncbi:DUF4238 domain-containing protein [Actinobacillus equuli subsp. equuli]|uniref:DUF4238 domain-containing protein n=1 Tax=Actinobacillus equuli subsp. equuli TaxID=202947 RepID=A0A9X4G2E6_ACTEU|nr:DUF4238 domain-containing protein [Actinobacillus equuli]MDE8034037.1 DUF4238 domain-containing protein [Actinobacillus equuli subsp. equuli]MDG4949220.1 DUF4238 domain-containing protein [Actinobacillus equuli subsp. haemolyticus]
MSNQQLSVNHHYISQFIIKNFYAEGGLLYSFNIKHNKINTRQYSAKNVCSEKNAHTIEMSNEKFIEIESFYSDIESKIADLLRKVQEPEYQVIQGVIPQELIEQELPEAYKLISFLLSFSYWRLPANKMKANQFRSKIRKIYKEYEKYGNEFNLEKQLLLDIAKKSDNQEKEDFAKKITQYIFLPILFSKVSDAIRNCRFVKTDKNLVLSDNPVICTFDDKTFDFIGDIYMPLSPNLCLTNAPEKIEKFQLKVFEQARNIVMANSQDILLELKNKCSSSTQAVQTCHL